MKTKKGAVDLTELAVSIILIGLVVSIGASILVNYRDSRLTDLPTYEVANESVVMTGNGVDLSTTWVKSIELITNKTSGATLAGANYDLSVNAGNGIGTLTNATAAGGAGEGYNVTYTVYNISDTQWNVPHAAADGLVEYGNWFSILAIVGIAAVVLALLFIALGDKNGGGGVSF